MGTMMDYINCYGNLDFNEKPYSEVDNLIFTQLIYNDFGGIVKEGNPISLLDAASEFCKRYSESEIDSLIEISKNAAHLLVECAKTRRFGSAQLCGYINNVDEAIDKQLAAVSFILSDGSMLTSFRGTDVTVTGVKESAMLSYMFPVPAQIEALHYFQETAMLHDGAVRLCGHSKGGNLAIFAAVNCSNSLKKKIDGVYACDAPGFPKWFFERYDYKQIEDKIHLYTPQGSVIGRMLYNAKTPEIIHSTNSGLKQHKAASWVIDDDRLERAEKYDSTSDKVSEYINTLIDYIDDDDLELFYNALVFIFSSMGVDDFYDLKEIDIKRIIAMLESVSSLDAEQKSRFNHILKGSADFAREYFTAKAKTHIDEVKCFFKYHQLSDDKSEE